MRARSLGSNGFLLPLLIAGLGMGILAGAQASQQTAPKVTVGKQLTSKASAPSPGATAKNTAQKTSIGKGGTSVKASQPSSFWTEELDVDDDGTFRSPKLQPTVKSIT